ncbi:TIM-barrel domain-containing protein [Vibrio sp. SCSIO 43136]|uniref:glycoside hydrolase family 31 protein n=1 Tax=Vibrio sp. SCSIO 43136 TaxID=2819101 RepID=UPI002074CADD|nr:TIM-barrel domain-containing protein [Vibrio sp. SCSIO 43136]USD67251.1 hypothetical protein J4N39_21710 [Vibrio sp. SCSIO 43136]
MKRPDRIERISIDSQGLLLRLDIGEMRVSPLREGTLRVSLRFGDEQRLDYFAPQAETDYLSSVITAWSAVVSQLGSDPQVVELGFGDYQLIIHQSPFYLEISHLDQVIYQDLPRRAYLEDNNSRRWHYHQREDQDCYYGLGEKTGRLERSSRRFRMNNVDAVGYDAECSDPLYKHIPFLVRYRPSDDHLIGLYYHNAHNCEFDIGSERSGYWGAYASYCVDGGQLDYVLMLGKTPQQLMNRYLDITGFSALPTKASLGYLGSTMYYTELEQGADNAVLGFVDECQKQSIPLSGFHLSSGYTKGEDGKRYTFQWNQASFPNPDNFVAQMAHKGMVLSPNVKPGLLTTHPLWNEFDQAGAFIRTPDGRHSKVERFWGGDASFVDFTNPDARALWSKYLHSALIDKGVLSIWNDNNEFEMDGDAICFGDGNEQHADALKPVLSNLMAKTAYDAVLQEDLPLVKGQPRPFILSRAGFAGIQRYAQTWSGDNDSSWKCFRYNIATMLGMSWSGVAFNGMDIGGFTGDAPSPELLLRWIQNGVFHPRFCIHSVNSDNTVTEPWIYPSILPQVRQAMQLRRQLLPTLYSIAHQVATQGKPMVVPLSFFDVQDVNSREVDTTFMLGDSLFCVAVTEPEVAQMEVYFPQGVWIDWYSGERLIGGQCHTLDIQWDYSPLYLRAGSGIFLEPVADKLQMTLAVWQSGQASFYDDDGKSMDYVLGESLESQIVWQTGSESTQMSIVHAGEYRPEYAHVELILMVDGVCPRQVVVNDKVIEQAAYADQQSKTCWYFDVETKQVHLEFGDEFWQSDLKIALNFSQSMVISMDD